MTEFTFDTSGSVDRVMADGCIETGFEWADLDPFTQGYVEALFASVRSTVGIATYYANDQREWTPSGFRHFAPETLAAIRWDCKRFLRRAEQWLSEVDTYAGIEVSYNPHTAAMRGYGRTFWAVRNNASAMSDAIPWPRQYAARLEETAWWFSPQTPYLGDDGKVYLRP